MKVFISWSGARSQTLAQALRDWMPLVLHYVEPWLSEADIAAGERWAQSLAKELESSNFGVICVTRENIASPWVLFEAGSLAKSLDGSRVIPLLLDVEFSEVSGPLAQFQAKKIDKGGLDEVIQSINQVATQPVPEAREKQLFEALWPEFEKQVAAIPQSASSAKPIRPQHEILEELVARVRSLDSRLREVQEANDISRPSRSRRRFHPFMAREMSHMLAEKPGDPITLLVLASMIREEIPWLYELGIEAYRAAKSGNKQEAHDALRRFRRAAEFTMKGGPIEEFGIDFKAFHMFERELERFLIESEDVDEEKAKPKRKKETAEE
jgi:TIR domain